MHKQPQFPVTTWNAGASGLDFCILPSAFCLCSGRLWNFAPPPSRTGRSVRNGQPEERLYRGANAVGHPNSRACAGNRIADRGPHSRTEVRAIVKLVALPDNGRVAVVRRVGAQDDDRTNLDRGIKGFRRNKLSGSGRNQPRRLRRESNTPDEPGTSFGLQMLS